MQAARAVERDGEGRRVEHGGLPAEVQLAHPEGDGGDQEDGQEGRGDDEEGCFHIKSLKGRRPPEKNVFKRASPV